MQEFSVQIDQSMDAGEVACSDPGEAEPDVVIRLLDIVSEPLDEPILGSTRKEIGTEMS